MNTKKGLQIPFHPFLLGFFPGLTFFVHNIKEVEPGASVRVFVVILVGISGLFLLLHVLMREKYRAAMMASIIVILFFSYGHIYGLIKHANVMGVYLGRHRYLVVVYFALLVLGLWITRKGRDYSTYTSGLNTIGVILMIFPLLQIVSFEWSSRRSFSPQEVSEELRFEVSDPSSAPDVYYIILDAYARDDTLLTFYEYDNSLFLEALENRGFFIARCSQSNYSRTHLSLGSTLNMNYIQEIYSLKDEVGLVNLVRKSIVRNYFEQLGYTIVGFDTAYVPTQWYDATIYYSFKRDFAEESIFFGGMSEYETYFFKTTAGLILLDVDTVFKTKLRELAEESPKRERYARIEYNLDKLETVPTLSSPKFVFAHINAPHEPYIFSRSGKFIPDQEAYIPGYRDQVIYINKRVLSIVDEILALSDRPPIIVLQGDHGGGETQNDHRRMHILNAYYLPDGGVERLYSEITPVNTFRVIFDTYWGTDYGTLPDVSYFSHWKEVFNFEVVPNTRPGCES